jgi:hypothetical protein
MASFVDVTRSLPSRAARRRRLAVLVGLALAASISACGDDSAGEPDAPAVTATASTLGSIPSGDAAVEPGTYEIPSSAWSVTDFSVTFREEGWNVQYGHVFNKHQDEEDELGFYAVVVDEIFDDPCQGEGAPVELGPSVDDLVVALRSQRGAEVSNPVDTALGDHPATRVDLRVPADFDLEDCRLFDDGVEGLQIWHSVPADKYFVLLREMTASVYILDIDGERQVFLAGYNAATSKADQEELQTVLDSIRIGS